MDDIDAMIMMLYQKKIDNKQDIGINIIKGCSEAILYASAACYDKVNLY